MHLCNVLVPVAVQNSHFMYLAKTTDVVPLNMQIWGVQQNKHLFFNNLTGGLFKLHVTQVAHPLIRQSTSQQLSLGRIGATKHRARVLELAVLVAAQALRVYHPRISRHPRVLQTNQHTIHKLLATSVETCFLYSSL